VDTAPPIVAAWFPATSSGGLNRFVSPSVTFNEAVSNATAATVTLRDSATNVAVPVTVSYDSSARQARLTVSEQLGALTTYRLTVSGVTDVAGNSIATTSSTFTTGSYGFYDIGTSPFQVEIAWLAESGITVGCGAGRFCPRVSVTREQMASFLVRALELPHVATDYFTDDAGSSHESDVNALAAAGVTSGCGPTTFCGGDPVTREQMAALLERAFGS
jgi:hypothetical protein